MIEEEPEFGPGKDSLLQRRLFWPTLILSILALALIVLWTQRMPIADNLISRELVQRNVAARYDIAGIGLRTQRLENLVLGDRDHPDLSADWVEVDIAMNGLGPSVRAVRAGGVRLRGRIVNGQLLLGELDKFRDTTSNAPLGLPDLNLSLDDARIRLETPLGPIGMKLDGSGHLRSGFAGKLAAVMPELVSGSCAAGGLTAYVDISVQNRQPRLNGPVRARTLACQGVGLAMAKSVVGLDVRLNEALDHMRGKAHISADSLASDNVRLASMGGKISFDGNVKAMKGRMDFFTHSFSTPSVQSGRAEFAGAYSVGREKGGIRTQVDGNARVQKLHMRAGNPVASLRSGTIGTPLEPIAARFVAAFDEAGRDNDIRIKLALSHGGDKGRLDVTGLTFRSGSGARADLAGGSRLAWSWPDGRIGLDGRLRVEGGGFPETAIWLTRRGKNGGVGGQIFVKDYVAGTARLSLEPVRFVAQGKGRSHFTTSLRLDGPLPGGRLAGLVWPVDGTLDPNGTVRINSACTPVGFTSLKYQSFMLDRTRLRLCPIKGGAIMTAGPAGFALRATLAAPQLKGRIGDSPFAITASNIRFDAPKGGFSGSDLKIVLGAADAPTLLNLARLTGDFTAAGLAGRLEGGAGRIGNVPLLMSGAAGSWRFGNEALVIDGGLHVADSAVPDRFNPLASQDFKLTLRNNRLAATGTLIEPRSQTLVTRVNIVHDLGSGAGQADLVVDSLRFDDGLQPEDVTRLALGVVANVQGVVAGAGQIRWDRNGVSSNGRFRTSDMNLAAAFGPVTGLSGEIVFSDLLGLETPPGQTLHIANVNPGIEAVNGVIHYQLIPGQRARIEGGKWPFAGGQLLLEPTTLDFSATKPRNLSFRIIGMQAGDFINQLELDNISATGTFDGLLPMIFDDTGGRIVGGVLVARQSGMPPLYVSDVKSLRIECDPTRQAGTLAYVGQVSNADLGVFGKLAFDALKSLRYKCLTILMDGNLDGEIVTQVSFNGVNQDPGGTKKTGMFRKFIGLPFIFNVRIEAPFRGLINTAQSFVDPTLLIRNNLGTGFEPVIENRLAVQPGESDTMPKGDK
ncbi:MAG: YdbH domain-containing protein [Alphaproteobacteria bacterium]|nr:YdbH domain-containing protein [Alphaproteobacteria bacterium]